MFRVDEAHEIEGLDVVKHNEPAYPIGKDTNLNPQLPPHSMESPMTTLVSGPTDQPMDKCHRSAFIKHT